MEDDKFRLTVENYGKKISFETHPDIDAEELVSIFYSAAVGLTFLPISILKAMKDHAEVMLDALDYDAEYEE